MKRFIYIISAAALSLTAGAQELTQLTANDAAARDTFASALSIRGGSVLAGAPHAKPSGTDSGAAYVLVGNGSSWSQQAKINPADGKAQDLFGVAVSVTNDTALISAPGDDLVDGSGSNEGSAYVFKRSGSTWSQESKLTASDAASGDAFGLAVSLDANTAVVGAPYDDDAGADSGSVYVFTRSGTIWSQQAKITPADGAPGDLFGSALAIQGDTLVIGSHRDDDVLANSGSVYVFVRSGSTWSQQAKLGASTPGTNDAFGRAVSLSGETLVAAASQDDDLGINSGSVFVFTRTGVVWTEQAKLQASDGDTRDSFGASVSLDVDTLVVGAGGNSDSGTSSGSSYLFVGAGASWTEAQKWTPTESAAADFFGSAVAIHQNQAVIGSGWDDDDGINSGSAHIFWAATAPPAFCTSKPSSIPGCVPSITAPAATASLSGGSGSFNLQCGPIPGGSNVGIFIFSTSALAANPASTPFGSLCLAGFSRGTASFAGGTAGTCTGNLLWNLGALLPTLSGVQAGSVFSVQAWYRDPPVGPAGANFSNGVRFLVTP